MSEINTRKRGKKWEYRFEGAKIDGKRKQYSKSGFATKKEAIEAGTKAYAEYNASGIAFKPNELSVSDYLDYWFDTYVKMNLKYNTQIGYLNIIEKHLKPSLGMYKLCSVTPKTIQEYVNRLKLKGFSKSSVVGIITTLSGAYNYAIEPLNYVSFNPCDRIKYPKFEKSVKERVILTTDEFKQIIRRFDEKSNFYIPLLIGYYTGLRISETFALTWDDINFENKTLSVNKITVKRNYGIDVRTVYQKKGKKEEKSAWYFGSPKTSSSFRTIPIGNTLVNALKTHYEKQKETEKEYGEYYTKLYIKPEKDEKDNTIHRIVEIEAGIPCALKEAKLICRRENGQFISTDSFKYCSRVIHNELKLAFDYHSLRHTHATILIENGVSPKTVQERLGHTDIKTTLQTYVKATKAMKSEAVDVFEKAVQ